MRYEGYVTCRGNEICKGFVQETGTEISYGTPSHLRVEDNNIDFQETGWQTRIGLIRLRTGICGRQLQTL